MNVGKVPTDTQVLALFPAEGGGLFATSIHHVFKLDDGAAQWSTVRDFTGASGPNVANYVSPQGTLYSGAGAGLNVWPPTGTGWSPLSVNDTPTIIDNDGNLYFFPAGDNVTRRLASTGETQTVVDCHTKDLLQCSLHLLPLRFDGHGALYFTANSALVVINRVYQVAVTGGVPKRLAALPETGAPNDYTYFNTAWVTATGAVFITAAKSSDAYSFGDTWKFEPGDTGGHLLLQSPTDPMPDPAITPAPSASIAVAPDGTVYSYLPLKGDVERYHPG